MLRLGLTLEQQAINSYSYRPQWGTSGEPGGHEDEYCGSQLTQLHVKCFVYSIHLRPITYTHSPPFSGHTATTCRGRWPRAGRLCAAPITLACWDSGRKLEGTRVVQADNNTEVKRPVVCLGPEMVR